MLTQFYERPLISRMTLNLCEDWQYSKKVLARYINPLIITHFWGYQDPIQWESKRTDLFKQSWLELTPYHKRNEKVTLLLTAAVLHADTEIRESISSVSAGPIIFNDEMFSDNSGARVKYSIWQYSIWKLNFLVFVKLFSLRNKIRTNK